MFNPLMLANWGAISRGLTFVSWLAVLVLTVVIVGHLTDDGATHHAVRHLVGVH